MRFNLIITCCCFICSFIFTFIFFSRMCVCVCVCVCFTVHRRSGSGLWRMWRRYQASKRSRLRAIHATKPRTIADWRPILIAARKPRRIVGESSFLFFFPFMFRHIFPSRRSALLFGAVVLLCSVDLSCYYALSFGASVRCCRFDTLLLVCIF